VEGEAAFHPGLILPTPSAAVGTVAAAVLAGLGVCLEDLSH
jgi:hypothetical protein